MAKRKSKKARSKLTGVLGSQQSALKSNRSQWSDHWQEPSAHLEKTTAPDLPKFFVGLLFLWYPLVALMSVYGHKYGFSPDLHMSSLIQAGGAALLLGFFVIQSRQGIYLYRPLILLPVFAFVAWSILSLLWAVNLYEGLVKILDWGAAALAAVLFFSVLRRRSDVVLFMKAVLAVAAVLLFIGYMQFYFDVQWIDQHVPPSITFNNKNMAAQYTLLLFPIALGMTFYTKDWREKLIYLVLALAAAWFILLTVTRGAIVALAAEAVFFVALMIWYALRHGLPFVRVYFLPMLGALTVAIILAFVIFPNEIEIVRLQLLSLFQKLVLFDGETRFAIWVNTAAMIKDHLFLGVGAGNWMVFYPKYQMSVFNDTEVGLHRQHINAHQDYLEMFAELGLVGIVLLALFGLLLLVVALRLIVSMRSRDIYIIMGLVTACIGLAVNSLGSFGMQQPLPICMVFVYAGVIDFYWRHHHNAEPIWIARPRSYFKIRHLNVPILATVLLLVSMVGLNYAWYRSELHFRQAMIAANKDISAVLYHGSQSLQWAPGRTRSLNFVAKAYTTKGDRARALETYEILLVDYPFMLHAIDNAATAYRKFGLVDKAVILWRKLAELRSEPSIYSRVGRLLFSVGHKEEAMKYIRAALNNTPEDFRVARSGLGPSEAELLQSIVTGYDRDQAIKNAARTKNIDAQTNVDKSDDANAASQ